MKTNFRIVTLILMALLIFIPLQSAAAQGATFDGQVIFGQSYTLKTGDTLTGDLLVFGGSATLEAGSTVNGNVVLFGGTLVFNGEISGDVAVIGGSATLGSSEHIHGNLTTVGGLLVRADGAQIDGQISNTVNPWLITGGNGSTPVTPGIPATRVIERVFSNFDPLGPILTHSDRPWAWPCWPC